MISHWVLVERECHPLTVKIQCVALTLKSAWNMSVINSLKHFSPISYCAILLPFILITVATVLPEIDIAYKREDVLSGQWWRMISCHFKHFGLSHLLLNCLGLGFTLMLFDTLSFAQWIWSFLCSALAVSFGLLWLDPQVAWYIGLSGVLHGFLIFGLIMSFRLQPLINSLVLVAIVGKLTHEQFVGADFKLEDFIGGSVLVNAHLYGGIGGAIATFPYFVSAYFRSE